MKRILLISLALILLLGAFLAYRLYRVVYAPNVHDKGQTHYILVNPGDNYEELLSKLDTFLINPDEFALLAEAKKLPQSVKPGRYALEAEMNNNTLVNRLRAGIQEPVQVTLNMVVDLPGIAGQASQILYFDSLDLLNYLRSKEVLADFKVTREELPGFFLANTYEFYWNTSPRNFVARMLRESNNYWAQRQNKLKNHQLKKQEIIILASIVESETAKPSEMPRVAGLYLNRLKQGIKLQSDPTVIYAMKQEDPNLDVKRLYYKDLQIDSKYNTYINNGLPPGPIRIPDPRSIDAVLDAEYHNFIYMCADPDRPGYHAFAKTLRQHNVNKAKYHRWADQQGIR